METWVVVCLIMYVAAPLTGIGMGLILFILRYKNGNFPEFFSPELKDTDTDFFIVSQNLRLVNELTDEKLTCDYFIKSQ